MHFIYVVNISLRKYLGLTITPALGLYKIIPKSCPAQNIEKDTDRQIDRQIRRQTIRLKHACIVVYRHT